MHFVQKILWVATLKIQHNIYGLKGLFGLVSRQAFLLVHIVR
jgi:hypothetical protein